MLNAVAEVYPEEVENLKNSNPTEILKFISKHNDEIKAKN